MYNEIQSAIIILNLIVKGVSYAIKLPVGLATGTVKLAGATLTHAILNDNKEYGKTSIKQMVARGGDMQVLQVNDTDLKVAEKMLKQYGVLYSILPDINVGDYKREILFHTEATPRINMILSKLMEGSSKVISYSDYLNNGTPEDIEKVYGEVEEMGKDTENFKRVSTTKEYNIPQITTDIAKNLNQHRFLSGPGYREFRFTRDNIVDESLSSYFVKLPYSRDESYMEIAKDKTYDWDRGFIVYFEKNEMIPLFHFNGQEKPSMKAKLLYNDHFDPMNVDILKKNYIYSNPDRENDEPIHKGSLEYDKENKELSIKVVTIDKSQIEKETEFAYFTKVPESNDKYIWVDKDRVNEKRGGNVIFTKLYEDESIPLYNKKGEFIGKEEGKVLYEKHYDPALKEKKDLNKQKDIEKNNVEVEDKTIYSISINRYSHQSPDETKAAPPLVEKETEHAYFTRVPKSQGNKYIWIDKEAVTLSEEGKTIYSKLKGDESIPIYNKNGELIGKEKGSQLYRNHYDPILYKTQSNSKKNVKDNTNKQQKGNTRKPQQPNKSNSQVSKQASKVVNQMSQPVKVKGAR